VRDDEVFRPRGRVDRPRLGEEVKGLGQTIALGQRVGEDGQAGGHPVRVTALLGQGEGSTRGPLSFGEATPVKSAPTHGREAMASWILTAHRTASRALENASMSPSPRLLISSPPVSATAARKRPKCVRRRSSAASSPSRSSSTVDATKSLNTSVFVPVPATMTSYGAAKAPFDYQGRSGPGAVIVRRSQPGVKPGRSP